MKQSTIYYQTKSGQLKLLSYSENIFLRVKINFHLRENLFSPKSKC